MDHPEDTIKTAQATAILRMLLDRMPCIAWATDDNFCFTSSFRAPQVFGNLLRNLKVGKTIFDLFQTTDPDFPAIAAHQRALHGEDLDLDLAWSGRIYRVHVCPLWDDKKQVIIGCLGFARDMTDALQTEGELIAQRNRAQNYLDAANVIFVVLDREGNITLLNQKGSEILGYEKDSLLGKDWFATCLPVPVRDEVRNIHKNNMLGEQEPFEYYENPVRTRSGEERIIEWHNTLLTDSMGRRIGTLSSGIDITERRKAEEALQKAHAKMEQRIVERTTQFAEVNRQLRQGYEELKNIYNNTVDGMLIADAETKRLVRANASIVSLLGYSEEELLCRSLLDIHPASELPRVEKHFTGLAKGQVETLENCLVLRKDGTIFYADIAGNKIDYHQRLCCIGFFRDTTERKMAHEALQKDEQILRRLLASSDQERQLIAYEIHDGLAQQIAGAKMQFDTYKHLATSGSEHAEAIFAEGFRLLGESLNEVRRIIGGLRPPVFDEKGVIAAIEHLVHDPRFHGGPQIEFHGNVDFDRLSSPLENALPRIVQEGLTNAQKFSQSEKVHIELTQQGSIIHLKVQDWGVGFDLESPRETGFGLEGIVQRARLLGGSAQIASAPGHGTQILVQLPVQKRENE